ncbi:zinc-dependent metalloprotease [Rhizocola hellebori]|nr:zinc-dependent metalloprotease [Rhizocola hellebori]
MLRRMRWAALLLMPLALIASPVNVAAAEPTTYAYFGDGYVVTTVVHPDGRREITIGDLVAGAKTPTPPAGVIIAEPGDCDIEGAWADEHRCGTNRFRWLGWHPTIFVVDYSGANWPVYEAAVVWNQSTVLNVGYRGPYWSGCYDGHYCLSVYSDDYEKKCGVAEPNTWVGCTHMVTNGDIYYDWGTIELDDSNSASYHLNQGTACHEIGHGLGLDHNLFTSSCVYYQRLPDRSIYPANGDFLMLESIYY